MRHASARPKSDSTHDQAVGDVARGGALNLVGNAVYGIGNFLLLAVFTSQLGVDDAGVLLVAIALFSIVSKVCELGATTGIIRTVSRDRTLGKQHELRANVYVGVAMSFGASLVAAIAAFALAPQLADVFADGSDVGTFTDVLRAIAPFLVISSVYTMLAFGSRGFDTMVPQVCIEKIGRALLQPVAVLAVLVAGGGVVAGALAWAVVQVFTLAAAIVVFRRLLHRAERAATQPPVAVSAPLARAFVAFSLPRALGQTFQVAIVWMDSLLISAFLGTREAGIYAVGTRYLLIGLFTAEAIMQVLGPRMSGLLAIKKREEAGHLYAIGTAWQTSITWSVYLVVVFFSTPLLLLFGDAYVAAGPALIWLSFGMMIASLFGPSDTVILMSGRSRLSMINASVAVALNLAGNILLIPRYGITGAGATWAVTLVIAAALPAYQARRDLGVHPWSRPLAAAVVCTVVGVGLPAAACFAVFGATTAGILAAIALGAVGFVVALWQFGAEIQLDTLTRSLLPSRRRRVRAIS